MKEPELVERIVYRLASSLDIPVTVKIRAGWNSERMNAAEVAQYAERGGAAAIFIHGRTREMMYRPSVILPIIKEVKAAVSIPVIGNGDITDGAAARKMLDETHCDGLMIGRAALGKPWIFDEIKAFLGGRSYSPPDLKETMLLHIDLKQRYKSDRVASNELRGQIPHYIKGKTGSASFRNRLNSATSLAELVELINEME